MLLRLSIRVMSLAFDTHADAADRFSSFAAAGLGDTAAAAATTAGGAFGMLIVERREREPSVAVTSAYTNVAPSGVPGTAPVPVPTPAPTKSSAPAPAPCCSAAPT